LAYMGDAVYELRIREYLINQGYTKVNELHKLAIKYVSATTQAKVIYEWEKTKFLTDEEYSIVRRGRNAKINHGRLNVDVLTYKHSTSFEALIGYLYLINESRRLQEIIQEAIRMIESW